MSPGDICQRCRCRGVANRPHQLTVLRRSLWGIGIAGARLPAAVGDVRPLAPAGFCRRRRWGRRRCCAFSESSLIISRVATPVCHLDDFRVTRERRGARASRAIRDDRRRIHCVGTKLARTRELLIWRGLGVIRGEVGTNVPTKVDLRPARNLLRSN